jgi:hypothetical protein
MFSMESQLRCPAMIIGNGDQLWFDTWKYCFESCSSQCSASNTQKPSCILPDSNSLTVITRHGRRRKRLWSSSLSFVSIKISLNPTLFAIATSKPPNTSDAFENPTKADRRVLDQLLQLCFVVDFIRCASVDVVIALLGSLEIA